MRFVALFALVLVAAGAPSCTDPAAPADPGTPSAQVVAGARAGVRMRVVDGVNTDVRDVPLLMAFDELTTLGYEVERIYLAANSLINANPEVLYAQAERRLSLDRATARAIADAHLASDIWDRNGGLTAGNVQSTLDFLAQSGAVPPQLRVQDVADLSYLDAVLREMGRAEPARTPTTSGPSTP